MFAPTRRWFRRHPRLRAGFLPIWIQLHHLRWIARNLITLRRPISFQAGNSVVKLHCDGQIPEALYLGFEANERDFVSTFLKPGMVVLDIGANVGLYTIMASSLVGSAGRVYSFEPSTIAYQRLLRNLLLNNCKNVVPNKLALSNERGDLILRLDAQHPSYDGHSFTVRSDWKGDSRRGDEIVPCMTMDEYTSSQDLSPENIDWMKIDVEGAELSVLQGARQVLSRGKNITLMLECKPEHEDEVERLMTELGLLYFAWNSHSHTLKPLPLHEALAVGQGNIFVRRFP